MKTNAVTKKSRGWAYGQGRAHALRWWVGTCPDCGEVTLGERTRKQAKDTLYRHRQQHRPGQVGCA